MPTPLPPAAGDVIVGVDFTSAPCGRKPITVAIGRWTPGDPLPSLRLERLLELRSFVAFDEFLRAPGGWIGGFDLPFGQSRMLIEHEGWPIRWPDFVRFYCGCSRESLRDTFRRWCDGRPAGDKFAWRKADRPAGSSPAMRWAHPPVAWMMHAGIGRMLEAGLWFPAHRHPAGRATIREPHRIALEAYPGFTARQVCRRSYKSDAPAGRTPERTANRRTILRALVAGTAGLDIRLDIGRASARRLVADAGGDLLDAVICGLQAAHAAALPNYGLPDALDPLEGWIASVPEAAGRSLFATSATPSRSRSPGGRDGPASRRPGRRRRSARRHHPT